MWKLPAINSHNYCNLPPTGQYLDCLVCLRGSALNNNRNKKRLFSLMNGVLNIKCHSSLKFSFCQKLSWQPKCAWLICLYELPTYHWKPLQQLDKRTVRGNCSCQVSNTMAYFLSINTRWKKFPYLQYYENIIEKFKWHIYYDTYSGQHLEKLRGDLNIYSSQSEVLPSTTKSLESPHSCLKRIV